MASVTWDWITSWNQTVIVGVDLPKSRLSDGNVDRENTKRLLKRIGPQCKSEHKSYDITIQQQKCLRIRCQQSTWDCRKHLYSCGQATSCTFEFIKKTSVRFSHFPSCEHTAPIGNVVSKMQLKRYTTQKLITTSPADTQCLLANIGRTLNSNSQPM